MTASSINSNSNSISAGSTLRQRPSSTALSELLLSSSLTTHSPSTSVGVAPAPSRTDSVDTMDLWTAGVSTSPIELTVSTNADDASDRPKRTTTTTSVTVEEYMRRRTMTPCQERWNALTIVPNPIVCVYYIASGLWLLADNHSNDSDHTTSWLYHHPHTSTVQNTTTCGPWAMLVQHCPWPVLAIAIGICVHAPCSFVYHWHYAPLFLKEQATEVLLLRHKNTAAAASILPAPPPAQKATTALQRRTQHWSRRLDQCMIHVCSALCSYGTTGSLWYGLLNALFCVDCVVKQCQSEVQPQRNQRRIGMSIVGYLAPLLMRPEERLVCVQLVGLLLVAGWFFAAYPIGGWSHCVFHIVMTGVPPLLLGAASRWAMHDSTTTTTMDNAAGGGGVDEDVGVVAYYHRLEDHCFFWTH